MSVALAPDPALPQRDRLVDPVWAGSRIAELFGWSGVSRNRHCRVRRVKYRVGESLRVLHELDLGRERVLVSLRAFPPARGARAFESLREPRSGSGRQGSRPPAWVLDPELAAVFFRFPADRRLASLPGLLAQPEPITRALGARSVELRLVAYAPEKSATFRVETAEGRTLAFAKVTGRSRGLELASLYRRLESQARRCAPDLRIPRLIGRLSASDTLLISPISGPTLASLAEGQWLDRLDSLGAVVARLHQLPAPAKLFDRLHPSRIERATDWIARCRPDLGPRVAGLRRRLLLEPPDDSSRVCLHGDLHPKNAIWTPRGFALIDLDQASGGSAAADLGSFLASLRYDTAIRSRSSRFSDLCTRALLRGYAKLAPPPGVAELSWYTAAALLAERALRAVNRLRPEGLRSLDRILDAAEAALGGSFDA